MLANQTSAEQARPMTEGTRGPRISMKVLSRCRQAFDKRWLYESVYAAIVVGAAALILSLVGRKSGWPQGGQYFNELVLVPIYAAHFRHLDFFPVWSSSDGLGLGSPVLLFYQKAFFYVSGVVFILLGGALKPTLIISIAIFLAIGAYGMRQALKLITDSRLLQVVGSVGFLFTNYVFTDWLVRGDLPEFSAMMIVPWLLYCCINLVKNRRVSLVFIPALALLVDAHSAIGLVSVFTLAIALVIFVAVAGLREFRAVVPRLLIVIAGATVLLAPTLLAELRFGQYYDPITKVTYFGQQVSQDFLPFGSYFFDGSHRWLFPVPHRFVQIDFSLWIPIVITLVGVVTYWAVTGRRPDRTPWGRNVHLPTMAFLVVSLCVYLFLQLRGSYWVYRAFSPLLATDYPYRMLAFITPLGVILVIAIADGVLRNFPKSLTIRGVAVLWLVSLIVLSPLTSTWVVPKFLLTPAGQFPPTFFGTLPAYINYRTYEGIFSFNGILFLEYLPKVNNSSGYELYTDNPLYHRLHAHDFGAASLSDVPCTVSVPSRSPLESLELTFGVRCQGPTRLALPVTFNAFSSVFVKERGGELRQIPYFHRSTDPRIIIEVPNSNAQTIVVHLPTLWGVLTH
jgi:hypothetical protein